ncbi:MAG: AraC family transcriptional regulator [Coriobacteriales bacterium]|nr:AraC family transcriptional regulator [Coriobacteriales bacterium]
MHSSDLPQWYGEYAHLSDEGTTRRLTYEYADGAATCTDIALFAGIHLGLMDVGASEGYSVTPLRHDVLEIVHCRRGRFECELARDACVCIAEGDFAVTSTAHIPARVRYFFPFNSFCGTCIVIDFATLSNETCRLLAAFSIDLERLQENLGLKNRWFVGTCTGEIERSFARLYEGLHTDDRGALRLTVLETLLLIERFNAGGERRAVYHSDSRARTVRLMRNELITNLGERVALADLARRHGISLTLFQNTFKDIYGLTPYLYLKHYKMHQAASRLLAKTESVAQIAQSLGYRNASKFANAFREVLGTTPLEYRAANSLSVRSRSSF